MATAEDLSDEQLKFAIDNLDFTQLDSSSKSPKNLEAGEKTEKTETATLKPKTELPPSLFETNLERFKFLCKDLPSPDLFIDFNFYFLLAASLNRKVWLGGGGDFFKIYPNLYIIFVAAPGIGKSLPAGVVNKLLESLEETKMTKDGKLHTYKLLNLGPDAITFEKLVQRASQSTDTCKLPNGKIYHHASTTFCLAGELGMLFCENTKRVVSFLMQGYDCDKFEGDTFKHGEKIIKNICLNFLGCTNPETMRDLIRTRVFDAGFTGRTLFLFEEKKRPHPPTIRSGSQEITEAAYIRNHLKKLAKLTPHEIKLSEKAVAWLDDWHYNKQDFKINTHPKLQDYYARKKVQLIKLAINDSYSDNIFDDIIIKTDIIVKVGNLLAAEKLLNRAEPLMHKATAMGGENPLSIIADKVLDFLKIHGATQKRKIYVEFYRDGDIEALDKVFSYLKEVGLCKIENVGGKDGIRLI